MRRRRSSVALGLAAGPIAGLVALGGCAPETTPATTPSGTAEPLVAAAPAAWTQVAPGPLQPRLDPIVAWAGDRFLVAGGWDLSPCPPNADCGLPPDSLLTDAATYDPGTQTWTSVADPPVPFLWAQTALADGTLYVLGHSADDTAVPTTPVFYAYTPADDTWTPLPAPDTDGRLATDGHVLVVSGGTDEQGPMVDQTFDVATSTWTTLPDDPLGPSFDRDIDIVDGRFVLTAKDLVDSPGGEDGPAFVRMASYDPATGAWTTLPDSEILGWDPLVASGRLVWPDPGGADGGEVDPYDREYPFGGIYDPAAGEWHELPPAVQHEPGAYLPRLSTGTLVTSVGVLLDPVTLATSELPTAPWDADDQPTFAAGPEHVLALGGDVDREPLGWILTVGGQG